MRALWLLPLVAAAGCGDATPVAPVAGRVTVNGQPQANAAVTFAPVGSGGNPEPGPSSVGTTDADGRYVLALIGQNGTGAVVGKHRVQVAIRQERDVDDDRPLLKAVKQLPAKYNGATELTFDVPPGGTADANFDLKVP